MFVILDEATFWGTNFFFLHWFQEKHALEAARNKALEQLMNATNESNNKDSMIRKLSKEIADLKEKADAMDQLAEQTSGVKIALARRLETLIMENKALKQNLSELQDQLAASQDISRVLNEELEAIGKDENGPVMSSGMEERD